jgi:hypothetical protein
MKRKWQVRRQFHACPKAAERWDQAYQCLLRWSTISLELSAANDVCSASEQEANHAHRSLCPRLDATSSSESKH